MHAALSPARPRGAAVGRRALQPHRSVALRVLGWHDRAGWRWRGGAGPSERSALQSAGLHGCRCGAEQGACHDAQAPRAVGQPGVCAPHGAALGAWQRAWMRRRKAGVGGLKLLGWSARGTLPRFCFPVWGCEGPCIAPCQCRGGHVHNHVSLPAAALPAATFLPFRCLAAP